MCHPENFHLYRMWYRHGETKLSLTELMQMPAAMLKDFDLIASRMGKARRRHQRSEAAKKALKTSGKGSWRGRKK